MLGYFERVVSVTRRSWTRLHGAGVAETDLLAYHLPQLGGEAVAPASEAVRADVGWRWLGTIWIMAAAAAAAARDWAGRRAGGAKI